MALQLVPYNNSMRLGQGFNSFAQQICIDNAVVGISDPDDSQPLRPGIYAPIAGPDSTAPVVSEPTKKTVEEMMEATGAVNVIQYPSQIVTYSSRYVSKLSEVANNLNISGSLSIKYGELSGGGSGSYVDAELFQQSDMNFLIVVKVINQTLQIKDQLQFWPLEGKDKTYYKPKNFTDVFGDCFISGFQEGGQFSAIVSIKALDKSNLTEIKANAHVALQVGVGSVEGSADVDVAKKNLNKNSEVIITVNWSGGGSLKGTNEKWDIDTLQAVAAKFPELVANCPQRTHAILTKYTALRGYLQWRHEDDLQPLDYDVAALYTSELLDIYMDYKTIWKEIHDMLHALESEDDERPMLTIAPPYAHKVLMPDGCNPEPGISEEIERFTPDFDGLDRAFRTCRRLMARIVQEVDAISADPSIALNANKTGKAENSAYVLPQMFRRLLPTRAPAPLVNVNLSKIDLHFSVEEEQTVSGLSKEPISPEIILGLAGTDVARIADQVAAKLSVTGKGEDSFKCACSTHLRDNVTKAELAGIAASALRVPVNDEGVQAGTRRIFAPVELVEVAPDDRPLDVVVPGPPLDVVVPDPTLVEVVTEAAGTRKSIQGAQAGSENTTSQSLTSQKAADPFSTWSERINFPYAYDDAPPKVVVFLSGFELGSLDWVNVCVTPANIGKSGFDVVVKTFDKTAAVDVSWFACPADAPNISCGASGAPWLNSALSTLSKQKSFAEHVRFAPRAFSKPPKTFLAIRGFAMGQDRNAVRMNGSISDLTKKGFNWKVETWANTTLFGAAVSWVVWQEQ